MNSINANCVVKSTATSNATNAKKNIIQTAGTTGAIIGSAVAGKSIINKTMFNKSYTWNTAINNILKKIGGSVVKTIAKTSGRQKTLGALALVAGTALITTMAKGAYKAGQINQQNKK